MKIEVGKLYRTLGGDMARVEDNEGDIFLGYILCSGEFVPGIWTKSGKWTSDDNDKNLGFDIVDNWSRKWV